MRAYQGIYNCVLRFYILVTRESFAFWLLFVDFIFVRVSEVRVYSQKGQAKNAGYESRVRSAS